MPRGYPTEKAIEDQVIALGETSMTQQEIAEMVGISRRQVGRIWHRVGVRQKGARSPFAVPQAVLKQVRGDVAGHGAQLLSVLQNLEDVDIFHPATEVTMYQLLSQEHGSWSMDTGQLRKASEGNLSVELWVKNQVGWLYLQQHLDGHPVWELMESWRVAVTRDVQA